MVDLITALPEAFSPALLAVSALLALAESALGLGVLVPGELGVLVLGAAARTPVQVTLALVVVTLAASAADHIGYVVGRRYGTQLRGSRVVRRIGAAHWDDAAQLARRRGATALVVSRLLPLVRTLMPAAAGAARMRYARFLAGSVAGSLLWAALWLGAGGLAGQALPAVATSLGRLGWVVLAVIVLASGLLVLRRRARTRAAAVTVPEPCPTEPVPTGRVLEGVC
ncbi:membrane protein DedA, SNARE-associated domain [Georgenia satyanarayanai]|uniref:Membrane protein DedA, SNARE-associated domain n=1 Tax=Georgenia satyanarayanai TaxID=860221 RepID=A0A2Y9ANJ2_9MICO|nr:DedA family protein [Georgenia satyanarayanai]PYF99005.1 membrane protein DedA with SNARE-associated domain [Georgenia satyanarayanai]SSA43967.1 membrane protein DedA, SNARE-associated domain [Georgenia satyanarayanai]